VTIHTVEEGPSIEEARATDSGRVGEDGQATAEYALVLVAAAVVALALITWASSTDLLPSFFNTVMQKVISVADGVG
jgi:Flp pilus assembly pilin Flp